MLKKALLIPTATFLIACGPETPPTPNNSGSNNETPTQNISLFTPISSTELTGTWAMIQTIDETQQSRDYYLATYSDRTEEFEKTYSITTHIELFYLSENTNDGSISLEPCYIQSYNPSDDILQLSNTSSNTYSFDITDPDTGTRSQMELVFSDTLNSSSGSSSDTYSETGFIDNGYQNIEMIKISDSKFPPLTNLQLSLTGTDDGGNPFGSTSLQAGCIAYWHDEASETVTVKDLNDQLISSKTGNYVYHSLNLTQTGDSIELVYVDDETTTYDNGQVESFQTFRITNATDTLPTFSNNYSGDIASRPTGEFSISYGLNQVTNTFFATGTASAGTADAALDFSYVTQ